jgi:hypothetical protein
MRRAERVMALDLRSGELKQQASKVLPIQRTIGLTIHLHGQCSIRAKGIQMRVYREDIYI